MSQVNNLTDTPRDKTTTYFNNYFKPTFAVSQDVNDAIVGYFEKVNTSKDGAKAMAGALIYTAKAQGMDPMAVLKQFATLKPIQANNYLAMFLNLNRVGTSMLGISNQPITNKYISRAILP